MQESDRTSTVKRGEVSHAELLEHGTDRDIVKRGESATVYLVIRNKGNIPINDIQVNVEAYKHFPLVGYKRVAGQDIRLKDQNIAPGEKKRVEYTTTVPESYMGFSTAGKYEFKVSVRVADIQEEFSKQITIE